MNQAEVLALWLNSKQARDFYRLTQSEVVEFEFEKFHSGHLSYGFLRFECEPSDQLDFQRIAAWPEHLGDAYKHELDLAVIEGMVEGLFMDSLYPYLGCRLKCVGIGWQNAYSTEYAFYKAALSAMKELRSNREWKIVIRPD